MGISSPILPAVEQCRLSRVSLDTISDSMVAEWESFHGRYSSDSPMHDPRWLRGYFEGQLEHLSAYLLHQSGSLLGVAPFLRKDWPLKWYLGELAVAKPQLRRLRLLGGLPDLPQDESVYDLLFSELAKPEHGYDALQLEEIPVDSFLWKYLHNSPLVRRSFRRYLPGAPSPHLLLRFRGSFDEYMKKFSKKHRHELRREVRRIREGALGEMRFVQYTRPEEVSLFLDPAVTVSKKTYQWNLHQRGLSATDLLRRRLLFAAENGWFRSYLMFCNDVPCAFLAGFQYGGLFLPHEMGFDPALSKYSVGTVLQMLVVEDLFAHNTPEVLDLGGYGGWKDVLSTESYLESTILLFRPGAYTRFVQEGHRICQSVTKTSAVVLDKLQFKSTLKKLIRRWAGS
jgi:hypothetical protein